MRKNKQYESFAQLIIKCRYERDVDNQISLLKQINEKLPRGKRIKLPTLMTDDYVSRALDIIEERIFGQAIYS